MGLFKKKSSEQAASVQQDKIHKTLERYGLDLENYSVDDVHKKNTANLQRIAQDLMGNKFFKMGMAFSFARAEEQAKVTYLSAMVEQNWILIRQNEIIIKELQALSKK